jgi:hypothetical protein
MPTVPKNTTTTDTSKLDATRLQVLDVANTFQCMSQYNDMIAFWITSQKWD